MSATASSGQRVKELGIFFFVSYFFSWAIEVPLALIRQGIISPILPMGMHYATGFGPMISTVVVTYYYGGIKGLKAFVARFYKWKANPVWWIIALSPVLAGIVIIFIWNLNHSPIYVSSL